MKTITNIINKALAADNKIKKILFGIALAGLSCAIWHNYIQIFDIGTLYGYNEPTEKAPLNLNSWFSAEYQQKAEENVVLGNLLSPFFIRVSNQIDYSLFGKIVAPTAIFGKDKYLYQEGYLTCHSGEDYVGEDSLRRFVQKMKFVQDTLEKLNKEFIFIQAPGKACYYPETLPEGYNIEEGEFTNYKYFSKLLLEYKINHIDFKSYILKSKSTTPYHFFTRTGVHWSRYAISIAMDSINHHIESLSNFDLPEVYWDEIEVDYAKFDDADIESLANLLFRLENDKYGYPELEFESHTGKNVPVVLMIGDSYLGNLYHAGFFENFDSKSQYWFYNSSIFSKSYPDKIHKFQLDQTKVLKNSDIVLLGCNECNIKGAGWKFIDDAYDYYKNGISTPQYRIQHMKKVDSCVNALQDYDMGRLESYCKKQNVTIDSAKKIDCLWKLNGNKLL